jgi:5-methylcytosine-specific restriction endonuclease McrA
MTAAPSALNSHVLVLNRLWMAIRVVDARRAFSMLVRDMAEVIRVDDGSYTGHAFADWAELSQVRAEYEADDPDSGTEWVRTVRMQLAVPKIIRLLGYDRLPQQNVKLNRRNIFARDHNRCQYCGGSFATSELSLDHVRPRSQGGDASWENLVCCCVACNSKKGGRTPGQARMPLIRPPVQPRRNPALHVRVGQDKYRSWRTFLDNAYWSVELK